MPRRSMRSEIVQAASTLFAERGLNAVSLKDVAEKAGIRHTSMYRIFKDKDDLFDAVLTHVLEEMTSGGRVIFNSGATAQEVVKAVVHRSLYHSVVGSMHRKLLFRALADQDSVALSKVIQHRKAGIQKFVDRLAEICGDRDPYTVYFAITALSSGYMHFLPFFDQLRPLKPYETDPAAVTEAVLKMVLPEIDWSVVPLLEHLTQAGAKLDLVSPD